MVRGAPPDDASGMDPYEVLQVHPRAEVDVIQAAYRVLARKHHPDLGGDARRMSQLNEAWAILGNPRRRAAFDLARRAAEAARPATAAAGATNPSGRTRFDEPMYETVPPQREAPRRAEPRRAAEARKPPEPQPVFDTSASADAAAPPPAGQRGTVLDFGRYAGWSVLELSRFDPDYLLWLERTPIGRRLRDEIQAVLGDRGGVATATRSAKPGGRWRR